jgi:hypothetical protein
MSQATNNSPKSFLDRLQEELGTIRHHHLMIQANKMEIVDLARVYNNLKDTQECVLTFPELVELGF